MFASVPPVRFLTAGSWQQARVVSRRGGAYSAPRFSDLDACFSSEKEFLGFLLGADGDCSLFSRLTSWLAGAAAHLAAHLAACPTSPFLALICLLHSLGTAPPPVCVNHVVLDPGTWQLVRRHILERYFPGRCSNIPGTQGSQETKISQHDRGTQKPCEGTQHQQHHHSARDTQVAETICARHQVGRAQQQHQIIAHGLGEESAGVEFQPH